MCRRLRIFAIFAIFIVISKAEVLEDIKTGLKVAKDEIHCGFHKLKSLVSEHQHEPGKDPCYRHQSTTPTTTFTEVETERTI